MRVYILTLLSLAVICFVGKYIYFRGWERGLEDAFKVYPDRKVNKEKQK